MRLRTAITRIGGRHGPIRWLKYSITESNTANCRSATMATTGCTMRCVNGRNVGVCIYRNRSHGPTNGGFGGSVFREHRPHCRRLLRNGTADTRIACRRIFRSNDCGVRCRLRNGRFIPTALSGCFDRFVHNSMRYISIIPTLSPIHRSRLRNAWSFCNGSPRFNSPATMLFCSCRWTS